MKKLFFTTRGPIELDENNEPHEAKYSRDGVANVFLIAEPTHAVYDKGGKRIELDAEPGDILLHFYESVFDHPILVVKSQEWKENIEKYDELQQKAAEKWAAQKLQQEGERSKEASTGPRI